jgi:hypothetical protein
MEADTGQQFATAQLQVVGWDEKNHSIAKPFLSLLAAFLKIHFLNHHPNHYYK